jgi:hypothetical protein
MVACKSWTWTRLLDGVHAEFVGGAVGQSALDAAASQQHREGGVVMISGQQPILGIGRAMGSALREGVESRKIGVRADEKS